MKISNWLFHYWWIKKLKEIQDLPFKMKIETDSLKSNSILEIENSVEPLWLSIKSVPYKLKVKAVQNNQSRIHRDDFGKQSVHQNPLFSGNQIAELISKFWLYRTVIIAFCIAESFLYCLTASLFVPGGGIAMQIPVAIFLAVLIMFCLDKSFEKHFIYREVLERHSRKELTDIEVLKFRDNRNIAYIVIGICFAALIVAGFVRIFYLEFIPSKGLTPERITSVTLASKMASIFTMLVTIITALFMAMLKRDQVKIGIKYRVWNSWRTANERRNIHVQTLIRSANSIALVAEQSIEKHWQLIIDLKRVYKMKTEYDEKYGSLNQEYVKLKSKPGFALNDDLYGKFSPIQCAHEELFKYGVLNAKEIKDKIAHAREILSIPEEHLAEHLATIPNDTEKETIQSFILPATNGKAEKHQFVIQ